MRQRAVPFALSLAAVVAIFFAVSRQVAIRRQAQDLAAVTSRLDDAGRDLDSANARAAELATEVEKLRATLADSERSRTEAAEQLQAIARQIEGLKAQTPIVEKLEAIQKDLKARASQPATDPALAAKVDQLAQQVAAIQTSLAAGLEPVGKLAPTLDQVSKTAAATAAQVTELAKAAEAAGKTAQKLTELGQRIATVDGATQQLLQKVAEASARSDGAGVAPLTQEVQALRERLATQDAVFTQHLADWRKEIEAQRRVFEALRGDVLRFRTEGSAAAVPAVAREADPLSTDPSAASLPPDLTVRAATPSSVVVDAGKRHGLAAGELLYITRSGSPVAAVRTVRVYDNLSGTSIEELVRGESVHAGDSVSREMPALWSTLTRDRPVASPEAPPPPGGAAPDGQPPVAPPEARIALPGAVPPPPPSPKP